MNTYKNSGLKTTQGRWPSPDPAGLAAADFSGPQSLNRYAYVMNETTDLLDPLGLGCYSDASGIHCEFWFWLGYYPVGGGGIWQLPCSGFVSVPCGPIPQPPPPSWWDKLKQAARRTIEVNRCAGELSQAGSVSSLSGGRIPELLGSNFFGDIASLATGGGGIHQGGAVAADLTAHAAHSIATQVAVGTATTVGRAISHTSGVYNPVTVGTATVTMGMKTIGKVALGAAEGVLAGKLLLDAGVYVAALVVCSEQ
jgi:hypothetical protein